MLSREGRDGASLTHVLQRNCLTPLRARTNPTDISLISAPRASLLPRAPQLFSFYMPLRAIESQTCVSKPQTPKRRAKDPQVCVSTFGGFLGTPPPLGLKENLGPERINYARVPPA